VQAALDDVKPQALIVDSIQTVFLPDLESAPGSVAQVRECAARLMTQAKGRGLRPSSLATSRRRCHRAQPAYASMAR